VVTGAMFDDQPPKRKKQPYIKPKKEPTPPLYNPIAGVRLAKVPDLCKHPDMCADGGPASGVQAHAVGCKANPRGCACATITNVPGPRCTPNQGYLCWP
jgi:hypothetical protein